MATYVLSDVHGMANKLKCMLIMTAQKTLE